MACRESAGIDGGGLRNAFRLATWKASRKARGSLEDGIMDSPGAFVSVWDVEVSDEVLLPVPAIFLSLQLCWELVVDAELLADNFFWATKFFGRCIPHHEAQVLSNRR